MVNEMNQLQMWFSPISNQMNILAVFSCSITIIEKNRDKPSRSVCVQCIYLDKVPHKTLCNMKLL